MACGFESRHSYQIRIIMQPYQERVVTEKKELDIKIDSLTDFLSKTPEQLDVTEKLRLQHQLVIMELYSGILAIRIKHF